MTDGLEQYHKLVRDQEGITNANCMAHVRRHFANAIKAAGQKDKKTIQSSIAYQALVRIGAFYDLEKGLKDLPRKRSWKNGRLRSGRWLRSILRG